MAGSLPGTSAAYQHPSQQALQPNACLTQPKSPPPACMQGSAAKAFSRTQHLPACARRGTGHASYRAHRAVSQPGAPQLHVPPHAPPGPPQQPPASFSPREEHLCSQTLSGCRFTPQRSTLRIRAPGCSVSRCHGPRAPANHPPRPPTRSSCPHRLSYGAACSQARRTAQQPAPKPGRLCAPASPVVHSRQAWGEKRARQGLSPCTAAGVSGSDQAPGSSCRSCAPGIGQAPPVGACQRPGQGQPWPTCSSGAQRRACEGRQPSGWGSWAAAAQACRWGSASGAVLGARLSRPACLPACCTSSGWPARCAPHWAPATPGTTQPVDCLKQLVGLRPGPPHTGVPCNGCTLRHLSRSPSSSSRVQQRLNGLRAGSATGAILGCHSFSWPADMHRSQGQRHRLQQLAPCELHMARQCRNATCWAG